MKYTRSEKSDEIQGRQTNNQNITYTRSLDLALQLVCSSVCCHNADWLRIFWQFL